MHSEGETELDKPSSKGKMGSITKKSRDEAEKLVVITGISKGLGRVLALELASRGHSVAGCARNEDRISSLLSQISSPENPSKHFLMVADVTSDSCIREFAKAVVESKGIPDIVVNNAGVINRNGKLWDIPAEEFDTVIDVNIKGTANVLRHFLPYMISKKRGIIINLTSGWGRAAAGEVTPYCASKWAIEGLTRSVAKELPQGIAVVALNPGVINTELLASCFGAQAALYQSPESWAPHAATVILGLTSADNGSSMNV